MNKAVKSGEVFKLMELFHDYEEKIVNMDVIHNDKMKFVFLAFDEYTGLSEHTAPEGVIVFLPDGKPVIGYVGKDHLIRAGEIFHFVKA